MDFRIILGKFLTSFQGVLVGCFLAGDFRDLAIEKTQLGRRAYEMVLINGPVRVLLGEFFLHVERLAEVPASLVGLAAQPGETAQVVHFLGQLWTRGLRIGQLLQKADSFFKGPASLIQLSPCREHVGQAFQRLCQIGTEGRQVGVLLDLHFQQVRGFAVGLFGLGLLSQASGECTVLDQHLPQSSLVSRHIAVSCGQFLHEFHRLGGILLRKLGLPVVP